MYICDIIMKKDLCKLSFNDWIIGIKGFFKSYIKDLFLSENILVSCP